MDDVGFAGTVPGVPSAVEVSPARTLRIVPRRSPPTGIAGNVSAMFQHPLEKLASHPHVRSITVQPHYLPNRCQDLAILPTSYDGRIQRVNCLSDGVRQEALVRVDPEHADMVRNYLSALHDVFAR